LQRGQGDFIFDRTVNVRKGERTRVKIEDVAFGGDGVARVDDFVLFVPGCVDADEVDVEVVDIKKNYGKGRVIDVVNPSPFRALPPCPYYGLCGGCSMQHISYPHQLELKKRQIEEALKRIAGIDSVPVGPVIPSPEPWGWRGKAEFHVAGKEGKQRKAGMMATKSHQIVEIERCMIMEESINCKLKNFRAALRDNSLGFLGERQIVWADQPGEPPVALFTGKGKPPDIPRVVSEKRMTVPGGGFFQANIFLAERLVEQVIAMASLSGGETVVDLYGGSGLFSIFLGSRAGFLFSVESNAEASRCARMNLDRCGFTGAVCYNGDVGDILKDKFVVPKRNVDVAVLDPPREGCNPGVIEALASCEPERVVYVSCNPATQARDIKILVHNGYLLESIQPFDMFPQTAHIEAAALLTNNRGT